MVETNHPARILVASVVALVLVHLGICHLVDRWNRPAPKPRSAARPSAPAPAPALVAKVVATAKGERDARSSHAFTVAVVDAATEAPVPDATVLVHDASDAETPPCEFDRTPEGRHVLSRPRPSAGKFFLEVAAPGYEPLHRPLTGAIDFVTSDALVVDLVPLSSLIVTVCDASEGLPIPGVDVNLAIPSWASARLESDGTGRLRGSRPRYVTATTDSAGVVTFDGLPPGTGYEVVSSARGRIEDSGPKRVEIPPDGVARVALYPITVAAIVGRIVDVDGRPGAGFDIYSKSRETRESGRGRIVHVIQVETSSRSADDGSFEISDGSYGEKHLRFQRMIGSRFEAFTLSVELLPGETKELGDIGPALAPGATTLRGRIVDAQGRPAAGAEVDVDEDSLGRGWPSHSTRLEASRDGTFEIRGLPAGAVSVWARAETDGAVEIASLDLSLEPNESREIVLELETPEEREERERR